MNWITLKKYSELSGYTCKALYNKIERGILKEGTHWKKSPDGRLHISVKDFEAWITGVSV